MLTPFTPCSHCHDGWIPSGWEDMRLISASTLDYIQMSGARWQRCKCWNKWIVKHQAELAALEALLMKRWARRKVVRRG